MAKVRVRVLNAVVDGKIKGSVIDVEEKSAKHLESIRYVVRVPKNTKLFDAGAAPQEEAEDAADKADDSAPVVDNGSGGQSDDSDDK